MHSEHVPVPRRSPISKRCVEKELGVSEPDQQYRNPARCHCQHGCGIDPDVVYDHVLQNACGINVSISMMVIILLANVLLSVGTPGFILAARSHHSQHLATMAGLPAGVMGVYISINTLCDMGATCVNVIGDMAGCVVLQEKIKLEEN